MNVNSSENQYCQFLIRSFSFLFPRLKTIAESCLINIYSSTYCMSLYMLTFYKIIFSRTTIRICNPETELESKEPCMVKEDCTQCNIDRFYTQNTLYNSRLDIETLKFLILHQKQNPLRRGSFYHSEHLGLIKMSKNNTKT